MSDLRFILSNPTEQLLTEINEYNLPQKSIAQTYALALRDPDNVDWPRVNKAIIERWSEAGLKRIKELAWSGKAFGK